MPGDLAAELSSMQNRIVALREPIARFKPAGGISVGNLTPRDYRYFALREQQETVIHQLDEMQRRLEDERGHIAPPMIATAGRRGGWKAVQMRDHGSARQFLVNLHSTDNIEEFLKETASATPDAKSALEVAWRTLCDELHLLEAMIPAEGTADNVVLLIRPIGPQRGSLVAALWQLNRIAHLLQVDSRSIEIESPGAAFGFGGAFSELLLRSRDGLHLFVGEGDELGALQFTVLPVAEGESYETTVNRALSRASDWRQSLDPESPRRSAEPFPPGSVVCVYHGRGPMTDLRTGATVSMNWPPDELRKLLIAGVETRRKHD
jgi:hypothetical protein